MIISPAVAGASDVQSPIPVSISLDLGVGRAAFSPAFALPINIGAKSRSSAPDLFVLCFCGVSLRYKQILCFLRKPASIQTN